MGLRRQICQRWQLDAYMAKAEAEKEERTRRAQALIWTDIMMAVTCGGLTLISITANY